MGGEADGHTLGAQRLELTEVVGRRLLAHPRQPAAGVGGEEHHERDFRLRSCLDRRAGLCEAEVVELADGGVAGATHPP